MVHRLEKDVNYLVEKIIQDYEKGRDIDVVENFMHPSRDDIVKIIDQIQNIIFKMRFLLENIALFIILSCWNF